jgi:hypothetical protein
VIGVVDLCATRDQVDQGLPFPASEQASLQVVPAAQVAVRPPLHFAVQAAAAPQSIEHAVLPVQSTVQPPSGHFSVHVLLP